VVLVVAGGREGKRVCRSISYDEDERRRKITGRLDVCVSEGVVGGWVREARLLGPSRLSLV
jgi:hypothetical protein